MGVINVNPDRSDKPEGFLRIRDKGNKYKRGGEYYDLVLGLLAVAEAFMEKGNPLAKEHFIAIVKELEERLGFHFIRAQEEKPEEPTKRRFYCAECKREVPQDEVVRELHPGCGLRHVHPGMMYGYVNEVPQGWPGEEPKKAGPVDVSPMERTMPVISESPLFCGHANEMPALCPCELDCYCKEHSCKVK